MTSTDKYNEFCFLVYTTNRYLHQLYAAVLAPFSLTYLQYMVLLTVDERGQVILADICHHLGLSNNTLTPVVQKLVAKRWLLKKRSAKDTRCFELTLSPQAAATLKQIEGQVDKVRQRLMRQSDRSLDDLISEQQRLNHKLASLGKMEDE